MSLVFVDPGGEPLRFFLPMSLASRNAFKEKIEAHGGVLVQSELMSNIIKIGDPARPHSYDASWLSFRYVDDAIRHGQLQNPEFYVMENPTQSVRLVNVAPTRRETPSAGGNSNGVGSRGTRMEFTPEEDDILRRIVHRPGVATSGNKIYQLIAQQYGGHSFHSWRDRYIRHMRPIWGPPTDQDAMDVNQTDNFILTQSYLRAPHISATERPAAARSASVSVAPEGQTPEADQQVSPATSSAAKKQRAAFSSTDDEILVRAIEDGGETASVFRDLAQRHNHHTWESWKNRVKALKKKFHGTVPKHQAYLDLLKEVSKNGDLSMVTSATAQSQTPRHAMLEQQEHDALADANIDPNLEMQNMMQMTEQSQQDFEEQSQQNFEDSFDTQTNYIPTQDLQMPRQYEHVDSENSFGLTTEEILIRDLQHRTADELGLSRSHIDKVAMPQESSMSTSRKRKIHIHDPNLDEHAGPVSDIEDSSQPATGSRRLGRKGTKKRKTNAAAQAAAERAAAQPRMTPATPHHQIETPSSFEIKSASQEHHEREKNDLIKVTPEDAMPDFAVNMAHLGGRSIQSLSGSQGTDKPWTMIQDGIADMSDDDLRAEEQIRSSLQDGTTKMPDFPDEHGFLQGMDHDQSHSISRAYRHSGIKEVRATPDSSPNYAADMKRSQRNSIIDADDNLHRYSSIVADISPFL